MTSAGPTERIEILHADGGWNGRAPGGDGWCVPFGGGGGGGHENVFSDN